MHRGTGPHNNTRSPVCDKAVSKSCSGLQRWIAVEVQPVGHAAAQHGLSRLALQSDSQEHVCIEILLFLRALDVMS